MEVFDKKYAIYMINNWNFDLFLENIDKFQDLDLEIITKLFEKKAWKIVISNLKKFKKIDEKIILKKAIDNWLFEVLAENIDKFSIDYMENITEIVFENDKESFLKYLENFWYINHNLLVSKLLEEKEFEILLNYREKLDLEDDFEIIKQSFENWLYIEIAKNIFKFKNIDEDSLVEKFFENWQENIFYQYKNNFKNLKNTF